MSFRTVVDWHFILFIWQLFQVDGFFVGKAA